MSTAFDAETIDVIAEAVAEKLAARLEAQQHRASRYVDAAGLATELCMSKKFVYAHKEELGAEPRGTGPKPRLRFDLERARAAMTSTRQPPQPPVHGRPRGTAKRKQDSSDVPLIVPYRGIVD